MAHSQVCLVLDAHKISVDRFFLKWHHSLVGIPLCILFKSAFGASPQLIKTQKCGFKQCSCVEIQVIFILFRLGGIFQISHKKYAVTEIWKSTPGIKMMVVKWVRATKS